MATQPPFMGTVKSFNPSRGWGFIECEEAMKAYGSDVFLLKGELQGFGVCKGDQISFNVKQSPKGIQAVEVQVHPSGGENQSFFGEIKTFNQLKGFGFIACPASEQVFGKDIFVMKSELPGGVVGQGAQVQFKAHMGERGPIATDVQVLGPNLAVSLWNPGWPQWGGQQAWNAQQQWGGPMQHLGSWSGGGAPSKAPSENEVFFGTLKNVSAEKGWGHVACDATQRTHGKDMFVMRSNLETVDVQPGQQVAFCVTHGPKGPHAVNIRPFSAQASGQAFVGVVKSFNDTKGWGFIESAAAKQIFMTDIFLHRKEVCGTQLPGAGDEVQFTVDISGGRAAAKDVAVKSASAPAAPRVPPARPNAC